MRLTPFSASRLRILCRLSKLGIRLTSEKQKALLRGDTSGAVIHPFFVYGAQALGMYFCEGMDSSPAMVRLRATHVKMCSESLIGIFKTCDWELMAQAAVFVISGCIILRLYGPARRYVQKSCEAVNTAKLQFIPTYGQPPEYSEGLHERFAALSQIIYFENFLFLTCGGAEPTMTERVEMEFKHQLRVRPATSSSCVSDIQRSLVERISGIVQDLSVDYAHASYFAG